MAANSKIEWTDSSWSPIRALNPANGKIGWHCEHATTGCEFCYAEGMNKRLGTGLPFKPGHRKDVVIYLDQKMLRAPLHWKKPRMIFVCSMTDAFAPFVTDEQLDMMFAVMALCPQHTFQVLTKRADRMRQWFANLDRADRVGLAMLTLVDRIPYGHRCVPWPLPNVWLGVSCERQPEADDRIPQLLQTRAAIRFVSGEPLLGRIDLRRVNGSIDALEGSATFPPLDWVIVGGESGPNARPMHPQWARDIRDECIAAAVPFFFKQWGGWAPTAQVGMGARDAIETRVFRTGEVATFGGPIPLGIEMRRVGKKAAGSLLDGKEWNQFPTSKQTQPASAPVPFGINP